MIEKEEKIEIDLKRLVLILIHRVWILLLVGVLLGALAFGYSKFFMTPMYSASTKLYVNNTYGKDTEGFSSSQVLAAKDLANTYMVIVESHPVLEKLRQKTGLNYSDGQLTGMISAAAINETEIFRVVVTCANPDHATKIANAIADALPEHISGIIPGSSVTVVEQPGENDIKAALVSPNKSRNAVIGFLIGFVICGMVIVVIELTNETISSEEYLSRVYPDIPLLAVIPDVETSASYGRYYKGYYAERTKSPVPPTATGGERK